MEKLPKNARLSPASQVSGLALGVMEMVVDYRSAKRSICFL
ncbi:MAG: hypothetical protein ACOCVM_00835 [Desulfovibrionaceae bacterium]